jgi:hypothetical protein
MSIFGTFFSIPDCTGSHGFKKVNFQVYHLVIRMRSHKIDTLNFSPVNLLKFRQDLFRDLRVELGQLKTCQNQTLTIGITGAGFLLALTRIDPETHYSQFILLLPLAILLPLWLMFFDKARTITRMVAFLRVQEALALSNKVRCVLGWETAMKEYWYAKDNYLDKDENKNEVEDHVNSVNYGTSNKKSDGASKTLKRRARIYNSTYWGAAYTVFFVLSLLCIIHSYLLNIGYNPNIQIFAYVSIPILAFICEMAIFAKILFYDSIKSETSLFELNVLGIVGIGFVIQLLIYFLPIEPEFVFNISDFYYYLVFVIALYSFILISTMVFWIFKNLVRGRYSTAAFEKRWEIIFREIVNEG